MVIKGSARGGAASLAAHLLRTDTNEKMELRELRGVVAENLTDALLEMEAVASGARSTRHFYHASLNTRADELLTPEQERRAIDRLEAELGLTDQARAVVAHVKEGRAHLHVVWSRIDLETMTAIPDSHNYRRHELVARELEREFGHARVQGAHIERDGVERPDRTPAHAEMQIAERTGLTPQEAKAEITAIWQRTDNGAAFQAALAEEGWILAAGDRRDFVVIDRHGGTHSLARRVEGAKAKDIRERLADLDPASLPSAAEARAIQAERQATEKARGGDARAPGQATAPDAKPQLAAASRQEATGAAHLGVAPQLQDGWTAEPTRKRPTPAEGARSPAAAAAKLADGAANLVGGLVDFLVGGPTPPPAPAEQAQRAEAAAETTKRTQAAAEITEQQRQDTNALPAIQRDQAWQEREERARRMAEEAKRQLTLQLELRRGRTR
jgi:hypothetical protein